jgi:2,3-bisphosphoglycerate-independent phosphoglycerate mutase
MKSFASSKKNIILLFIDGVGVGTDQPEYNPCYFSETGIFNSNSLPMGGEKYQLDANLGIDGLPQSATGQTSIYTGINAAHLIGRHLYGFPNQSLRKLLYKESIFVKLTRQGYACKFLNAFRPVFFTTPQIFNAMPMSATTEMNRAAGRPFSTIADIRSGKAIYHDYTNQVLRDLHFDIPVYNAFEAAHIIRDQSEHYDLLLYEYFETDRAGHDRDLKKAIGQIHKIENLIAELLNIINPVKTSLIVASDHGNIEDLRTKSHTRNPAYCAIWNKPVNIKNGKLYSLTDIFSLILNILKLK